MQERVVFSWYMTLYGFGFWDCLGLRDLLGDSCFENSWLDNLKVGQYYTTKKLGITGLNLRHFVVLLGSCQELIGKMGKLRFFHPAHGITVMISNGGLTRTNPMANWHGPPSRYLHSGTQWFHGAMMMALIINCNLWQNLPCWRVHTVRRWVGIPTDFLLIFSLQIITTLVIISTKLNHQSILTFEWFWLFRDV